MRKAIAIAAAFEVVVSAIGLWSQHLFSYLLYFNPHIVVIGVEMEMRGHERGGWSTLFLGAMLLAATPLVARFRLAAALYVLLQGTCAIAATLFFALIFAMNVPGNEGPSRGEIVVPTVVLLLAVVLPTILTIRETIRRKPIAPVLAGG